MVDTDQKPTDQVRKAIRDTLESLLDQVHMVSVDVEEECDPDGDPVLHVIVVYESDDRELDASKLSGLLRHLRLALSERGEDRFPVMSFIAAEECAGAA